MLFVQVIFLKILNGFNVGSNLTIWSLMHFISCIICRKKTMKRLLTDSQPFFKDQFDQLEMIVLRQQYFSLHRMFRRMWIACGHMWYCHLELTIVIHCTRNSPRFFAVWWPFLGPCCWFVSHVISGASGLSYAAEGAALLLTQTCMIVMVWKWCMVLKSSWV